MDGVLYTVMALVPVSIFMTIGQLLKFVDLHKTPSLEFGLVLIFSYLPYALAEGIYLSGTLNSLFLYLAIILSFIMCCCVEYMSTILVL